MSLTTSLLRQIESLGYLCDERNEGTARVIIAEPMVDIDPEKRDPRRFRQIVRYEGGDDERYLAACQLATQCGIRLDD